MHGLETITHIGERPPDDHAHRVIEVGLFHLPLDIYRHDFFREITHTSVHSLLEKGGLSTAQVDRGGLSNPGAENRMKRGGEFQ